MKRFLPLLVLLFPITAALALTQSASPPKFPIPWGASAGSAYIRSIPTPSQIGIQNCAASLTDGFPPLTFVPSTAGGCPPFGQDFNGFNKQVSQWAQWPAAGAPVFYDSAFATAIGGYPKGAMVMSSITLGDRWMSISDNNSSNPDAGGGNWVQDPGQIPIGTPVQAQSATVPFGYIAANGLTIGNASSNATGFADPSTQFLFAYEWTNCVTCSIFTSAGSPTTKGATAAADFAANKAITTPNMKGLGLMGVDTMGGAASTFLSGVPVQSGPGYTVPGTFVGENLHSLVAAENGPHNHTLTDPGHTHLIANPNNINGLALAIGGSLQFTTVGGVFANRAVNSPDVTINPSFTGITIAPSGSGVGHNTVERSSLVYWNLKL